jgi:hypothetical protein
MKEVTFKQAFKVGAGLAAGAVFVYSLMILLFGLTQMLAMFLLS